MYEPYGVPNPHPIRLLTRAALCAAIADTLCCSDE